jgi:hypothetical protein
MGTLKKSKQIRIDNLFTKVQTMHMYHTDFRNSTEEQIGFL